MPLEVILKAPKTIGLAEYEDRDPTGKEVMVRTLVSGIKSGTEINLYRGAVPFVDEVWDPGLRLFRPAGESEKPAPFFPHTLGSWAAGKVDAVGPRARRFKPGDLVHGEWRHRQTAILEEDRLYPVAGQVDCETMVFTDPARFALASIHDAGVKLGDRAVIFGLGAIGMLALQMARLDGAVRVFVVDPIPGRLDLARSLGADEAINPTECDVGIAVKELTENDGVDVAIEVSGSYAALQQALRCVHEGGLVVAASYYAEQPVRLDLSREWHHNRITLRSSMPVWECPHRSYPMWDLSRLEQVAIGLLQDGSLQVKPLIGARIPFERAGEAYALIDQSPDARVKFLLTYQG